MSLRVRCQELTKGSDPSQAFPLHPLLSLTGKHGSNYMSLLGGVLTFHLLGPWKGELVFFGGEVLREEIWIGPEQTTAISPTSPIQQLLGCLCFTRAQGTAMSVTHESI